MSSKIAKFILDNPSNRDINVNVSGIIAINTPNHAISTAEIVVGIDSVDKEMKF